MHEAKVADEKEVVLWGSGTPKREFLYVDDLANALVFLATLDAQRYNALVEPSHCPLINVGSGVDLTIRELAEMIAEVVGYQGNFVQETPASRMARCARSWMYLKSVTLVGNRRSI